MKKTPLNDFHKKYGGKLVDFAGWELPVRFSGTREEHLATRTVAALYDISHMGEILVEGSKAEAAINYLCSNDIRKIPNGKAQYTALLNEQGGVVDDLIIYKYDDKKYLLCVNASNSDKDYEWMKARNKFDVDITNASSEYGQIAIQGPKSELILSELIPEAKDIKYFHFQEVKLDSKIILSRTGYTGEDGYELFIPWDETEALTEKIYQSGLKHGLLLCGLGARDTLRLEVSYPLHGHELREDIPAISSGLSWIIDFDKEEFIGKEALLQIKAERTYPRLCGFIVEDPGIVREESKLFNDQGEEVGFVTSGTKTPTIDKALGMAIVEKSCKRPGTKLFAEVRGRQLGVQVVKPPFYQRKR